MKVAITGHRFEEYQGSQAERTHEWLTTMGRWMKDRGMTEIISGMATGADLWWAEQHRTLGVPLHAYVPFWKQSARWDIDWVMFWDEMILSANDVTVIGKSDPYDESNFFKRNDAMIADADELLVVWKKIRPDSGTAYTFENWKKTGKPWYWYDPDTNVVTTGRGNEIHE